MRFYTGAHAQHFRVGHCAALAPFELAFGLRSLHLTTKRGELKLSGASVLEQHAFQTIFQLTLVNYVRLFKQFRLVV